MLSRPILFLLLANILGGLSYAGMKLALRGMPEISILVLRLLVALPCFALMLGRDSLRWPYRGRDLALMLVVGIGGFAGPLALGIVGLRFSTAANASILVLLEPIGIVILAAIFLRERANASQVLGIVLGLAGACLVVLSGDERRTLLERDHLFGNLILALHGFLWSLFTVAAKPLLQRHSPLSVTYCSSIVALLALVPLLPFELRGRPLFHGPMLPALFWVAVLGIAVSFGSTLLWIVAVRAVRPIVIAAFVFVQPIVGSIAGYLVFDEQLSRLALSGAALICLAVFLVARGEPEAKMASQSESA